MVRQPSLNAVRVAVSIIHPVAILCTAFRLVYRWRQRRFWWDDTLAGFSMLFDVVFFVVIWIRTFAYPGEPMRTKVVSYWIVSFGFTFVLWSARLSILLSIIRATPPVILLRKLEFAAVALFACIWVALVAQKAYKCGKEDTDWKTIVPWAQCKLGKQVAITELVTDFVGDAILVYLPIQLLWQAHKLTPNHRTLLLIIFSGSMVTTICIRRRNLSPALRNFRTRWI
ncbi:hypothetical protein OE88DRAFT_262180 [Heliocybe sulcata]|uniref:Rhodopsin domain-containing protein n=1 Tax=Heliocybe sulcata TaxID=5364 RepID=A0A5C3N0C9_9AGAM|nr:hypothetical protein OE88DRAFT_262180 [Heliocybe sulcata]